MVSQAVQLFTGTVYDNITLGDDTITTAQVDHAAQIAGAHDLHHRRCPTATRHVLSDTGRGTGVALSAGQRQLLALARALVAAPRVLLLDEATAVIDGASDAALRTALRDHVQPTGTAILTVAHRLSTARDADRIIVLSGGRIIEHGTPAAPDSPPTASSPHSSPSRRPAGTGNTTSTPLRPPRAKRRMRRLEAGGETR